MGLEAAFIAFSVVSAGAKIIQGVQQNKAAKAEAAAQEEQGRIQAAEAQAEAQRVANDRRKFRKKQKAAFLKNGITLAGSPLLVLEETRRESQEEVDAIVRRGNAQSRLAFQRASITRAKGRSALLGGIGGAFATGVSAFATGSQLGFFGSASSTTTTT